MAALKYWLWLTTAPALSNRAKLLLLEHFSSPEDVYYAQPDQLCLVEGITRQQAESLSDKSLARAEKVLADCVRDGQFIVTMDDAAYPARLRDMYDPPVLLYGKGSMPLFARPIRARCGPAGSLRRYWAAARTWSIRRRTAVSTRTSPPPAYCCRSTRRARSRAGATFPCATASSAA